MKDETKWIMNMTRFILLYYTSPEVYLETIYSKDEINFYKNYITIRKNYQTL
jgi:hypothetical protein